MPLLSIAIADNGVLWQRIFANGSLTVGDQSETTPLELPKHTVPLYGFCVITEVRPKWLL